MRINRAVAPSLLLALLVAAPAAAQRGARQHQVMQQKQQLASRPRAVLLQRIHQQLMNQARNRMGLTPEQFPRFQRTVMEHARGRAPLEQEEDRLRLALREQVQLGAAGDQDSTARLLEALNSTRATLAATYSDEMRDLSPILTPVQRAQWQGMRDRWMQQVRAAAAPRPDSRGPGPQP